MKTIGRLLADIPSGEGGVKINDEFVNLGPLEKVDILSDIIHDLLREYKRAYAELRAEWREQGAREG